MTPSSRHDEGELAKDILEYFIRNPQSADDLEGVAHWRLLDQTIQRTLDETKSALEWLVAQGFLSKVSVPGSSYLYALNPQKRDEAEQLIRHSDPPTSTKPWKAVLAEEGKERFEMPIVENRTKQLLIIPRNSGPSIYLAPGESAQVPAFEIDGNAKVEKLQRSGSLAIETEKEKPARDEGTAKKTKSETR